MAQADTPEIMRVDLDWEGAVAVLTINNVKRRNAFSDPVKAQLHQHMLDLVESKKCRAIVLTGAQGNFCAGGDVKAQKERVDTGMGFMERRLRFWHGPMPETVRMMVEGPKPVVTAVEGAAFGAGLSFAIASDVTIAARDARFGAAQIRRGLAPDGGLFYLLVARAGEGRARELMLSGREFAGEEALRYGVAHDLCEPGGALAAAMARAQQLAEIPPLAYALTKGAIGQASQSLGDCFRAEWELQPALGLTRDHQESVAAFLEKRKPNYTGD